MRLEHKIEKLVARYQPVTQKWLLYVLECNKSYLSKVLTDMLNKNIVESTIDPASGDMRHAAYVLYGQLQHIPRRNQHNKYMWGSASDILKYVKDRLETVPEFQIKEIYDAYPSMNSGYVHRAIRRLIRENIIFPISAPYLMTKYIIAISAEINPQRPTVTVL